MIVVLPAVTLSKPVNVLANFTFKVPVPSDTTPMLPSDNVPVAPPLTDTFSPSFLLITAPESPSKFKPFSIVLLMVTISPAFFAIFCVLLAILPAFVVIFCLLSAIACLFLSI